MEFADGSVWGRDLFPGICEEFADGSVWGRGFFPLPFVAFGSFGTGEGLLWYATRFQGHSVRRTGFSGTGVILNCCKGSTNREKYKK